VVLWCGLAAAAQAQPHVQTIGGSVGDTDFGTGLRLFIGGPVTPVFGWEAQVTSFGSDKYQQGFNTFTRSAWALGASAIAHLPMTSTVSAFGKLGGHYLNSKVSGPGTSTSDNSFELGIGAGLQWQFLPTSAARLEFENIGGSGGNFVSLGLQFKL
jgi:opacity protein-like surface antigen